MIVHIPNLFMLQITQSWRLGVNNFEENFPNWFLDLHNLHLLGYSKQ